MNILEKYNIDLIHKPRKENFCFYLVNLIADHQVIFSKYIKASELNYAIKDGLKDALTKHLGYNVIYIEQSNSVFDFVDVSNDYNHDEYFIYGDVEDFEVYFRNKIIKGSELRYHTHKNKNWFYFDDSIKLMFNLVFEEQEYKQAIKKHESKLQETMEYFKEDLKKEYDITDNMIKYLFNKYDNREVSNHILKQMIDDVKEFKVALS